MSDKTPVTGETLLAHADSLLAVGMQYGLWVEKAPNVEEQIALSSMSQDKLGHARQFQLLASEATGRSLVELQYDRGLDAFRWAPAWVLSLETWYELIVAQVLFGRALMHDLRAYAASTPVGPLLSKIDQEEGWHLRHGDAWLSTIKASAGATRAGFEAAFDRLWPFACGYFGVPGSERFEADVASGARTQDDDALRQVYLADIVPRLEAVGLKVPAHEDDGVWQTQPEPTQALLDQLTAEVRESALEVQAMLQDPVARAMAEL